MNVFKKSIIFVLFVSIINLYAESNHDDLIFEKIHQIELNKDLSDGQKITSIITLALELNEATPFNIHTGMVPNWYNVIEQFCTGLGLNRDKYLAKWNKNNSNVRFAELLKTMGYIKKRGSEYPSGWSIGIGDEKCFSNRDKQIIIVFVRNECNATGLFLQDYKWEKAEFARHLDEILDNDWSDLGLYTKSYEEEPSLVKWKFLNNWIVCKKYKLFEKWLIENKFFSKETERYIARPIIPRYIVDKSGRRISVYDLTIEEKGRIVEAAIKFFEVDCNVTNAP